MNYYERIQNSIDYMERNLEEEVRVEDAAKEAYMSLSNFHRMFFALAGYSAKEYIRYRRISLAAIRIREGKERLIDIAGRYAYESVDSFSRTFENVTGILPSKYSGSNTDFIFERIDLMDKYFNTQDKALAENYPDIKVLKELAPMRVAYYRYFGTNPEEHALGVISDWVRKNKIQLNNGEYRIFGYNSPDTNVELKEYGYEVCLTIPDNMVVEDDKVKVKELEGGLYAVTGVERGDNLGENIMKGWQRFNQWLKGSKYLYGNRQWLEEHLSFDKNAEHIGGTDLYMPIMPKTELNSDKR
jgi:AraC-like DNA-binding protein/DNA gyrase inhibitor GyrI